MSVGPVETRMPPPVSTPPPVPLIAPSAGAAPAAQHTGLQGRAPGETSGAIDERTLDQIAQRLVKRDPDLAIEKDSSLTSYVYKFLDRDSGDVVRQFPAKDLVATIHALQLVAERMSAQKSTDLEV